MSEIFWNWVCWLVSPTSLPLLPLSWPWYKVNVVPAGTPLPSHFRAEGRAVAPTPARSWELYPLYGHCGTGGGAPDRSGTTVRGHAPGVLLGEKSKGAWHSAQHTGASRKSMCLEKRKQASPGLKPGAQVQGWQRRSGSSKPYFLLFWILTFLFQKKK